MLAALFLNGFAPAEIAALHYPVTRVQSSQVDWDRAERIDVVLSDFDFTPSRIRLRPERPYRLHLENRGSGGHNLTAPDFFRSSVLREGPVANEVRASGSVEVARGEAKAIDLVPLRTGDFPMRCSHFLHSFFGMTGRIAVE
jgi:uncharacterized cupredoxin-like copper-binding protein